ncbi:Zinc ribbon domain-containing protein OS=Streptomyces aurantiogriseus OX=66870 GN=GCM10010251_52350 PE=4 SV=1 [Streptomyces aurantiogriseus]
MDYCHPCRRHLNGALACPGCGTPVEQLRAYPQAAYEPEPYTPEPYSPGPYEQDASVREAPGDSDQRDQRDDRDDREVESGEPQGRAARRREQGRAGRRDPARTAGASEASRRDRKAAVHRRRRKRTVLITVGFVLAAGGLSLAELGIDAPGFSSSRNPAAAGGESSEVDGSTAEPSASAQPLDDRADAGGAKSSPSPDASASPSASPSPSESPDDEDDATQTPDKEAQSTLPGSSGSTPGSTAPPDSGSTPTADPTASDAPPKPSPSETCTRFLWWCS